MNRYGWMFILWVLPVLAEEKSAPAFEQQARQILRNHLQKAEELQVGEQVEELAVDDLSRRGLVPRIEPLASVQPMSWKS